MAVYFAGQRILVEVPGVGCVVPAGAPPHTHHQLLRELGYETRTEVWELRAHMRAESLNMLRLCGGCGQHFWKDSQMHLHSSCRVSKKAKTELAVPSRRVPAVGSVVHVEHNGKLYDCEVREVQDSFITVRYNKYQGNPEERIMIGDVYCRVRCK